MLTRDRWPNWIEAGIITVGHISHSTKERLLGQEEIFSKFQVRTNFLDALSLRSSIPTQWKRLGLQTNEGEAEPKFLFTIQKDKFDILNSHQRKWYSAFVSSKAQVIKRKMSWTRDLTPEGSSETSINWEETYALPYRITRETKLQTFAYKLVHRLSPCNKYLHTIRIKESPLCNACQETDSLTHFFVECPETKLFWGKLGRWCEDHIDLSFRHLTTAEMLLGQALDRGPFRAQKMLNWIILVGKYYLQRQELFHGGEFSLLGFLAEIKHKLLVEKIACKLEMRPHKFLGWLKLWEALGG